MSTFYFSVTQRSGEKAIIQGSLESLGRHPFGRVRPGHSPEQLCAGINHKLILRRAMRDLLPEAVRQRRGLRTGPGLYIEAGLRCREANDIIDDALIQARGDHLGLLDINALRSTLLAFRTKKQYPSWSFSFWMALSLELWLQAHSTT